jgi:hypothetical protein
MNAFKVLLVCGKSLLLFELVQSAVPLHYCVHIIYQVGGRLLGRERKVLPSVVDAIGNTPLVELSRLVANTPGISPKGRILAKLENLNPGKRSAVNTSWVIEPFYFK